MLLEQPEVRLLTVHGLPGSGTSTSVRHALGARPYVRVDGSVEPKALRAMRSACRGARWIFLDDVVHPAQVRRLVEAWLDESEARVVVAARAPLHLSSEHRTSEHRVPLGLFGREATRALFSGELLRLGAVLPVEVQHPIADATDGWWPAIESAAIEVRLGGASNVVTSASIAALVEATSGDLPEAARTLLGALALCRGTLDVGVARDLVRNGGEALQRLDALGLLLREGDRIRVPRPIARALSPSPRASKIHAAWVLETAEAARAGHRRDPVARGAELSALAGDLYALALSKEPRVAVRAALALEPISFGRLARADVLALWSHAARAAQELDDGARADVAIGWARTAIGRGDHESAEALLREGFRGRPRQAAQRAIFLGHVAAWRVELERAHVLLDEAAAHLLEAREDTRDVAEDLLLQRVFLAHQRGDLDETERLCRILAAEAALHPSPRMLSLARRFVAEVEMRRGRPQAAAALFEETMHELTRFGDEVGALYLSSRLVEALRAAGETKRADEEATRARIIAARAEEATLELTLLEALEGIAPSRIAELAWRTQIPSLREAAAQWVARNEPRAEPILRIDPRNATADATEGTLSLSRRPTLARVLDALIQAHGRSEALSSEALFAVGWPGERVDRSSQRQRVQTAIWALRRGLLGEALITTPQGYLLSPALRIVRAPE